MVLRLTPNARSHMNPGRRFRRNSPEDVAVIADFVEQASETNQTPALKAEAKEAISGFTKDVLLEYIADSTSAKMLGTLPYSSMTKEQLVEAIIYARRYERAVEGGRAGGPQGRPPPAIADLLAKARDASRTERGVKQPPGRKPKAEDAPKGKGKGKGKKAAKADAPKGKPGRKPKAAQATAAPIVEPVAPTTPTKRGKAPAAVRVTTSGDGPYRYVIVKNGQIVVDAGPMPTDRGASIAAHTLLRTKAQAFMNPISQKTAFELIQAGKTGLEKYGQVVDGYTMEGTADEWEAYIYLPNDATIAYSGARGFDRLMRTGKGDALSLRNVPDSFAARTATNRRNSRFYR